MKNIPYCLRADAYTIGSNDFASQAAKEKSVYNFTNRYGADKAFPGLCHDSRMVFFGTDWFVRNYLPRVTAEDVDDAEDFMKAAHSFGGEIPFDREMWDSVVNDYNGFLPIRIESVEDGQTFFPNQPVVQVQSTASGFGELAAHIEAELVGIVSNATVRLTVLRHWYERILDILYQEDCPADKMHEIARFMIHDFGYRASSCPEESLLYGYVHLLVFNGTDTFHAAALARKHGAEHPIGTSIQALAHRNVLGYEDENECFSSLLKSSKKCNFPIASYVGDCFNWKNALDALAELAKANPDCCIVARPDSGDSAQTVIDVCDKNLPNLRFLQGDGVDYEKFTDIISKLHAAGHKLHNKGIFGIGGWLRNICTRDTFSSAYKLCAVGNELRPVCKLSESLGKMSIPGPTILKTGYGSGILCELESECGEVPCSLNYDEIPYHIYYENGHKLKTPDFLQTRYRVNSSFNKASGIASLIKNHPEQYREMFSVGIRNIQDETISKHRN